jgi:hypothetical protein
MIDPAADHRYFDRGGISDGTASSTGFGRHRIEIPFFPVPLTNLNLGRKFLNACKG